MCEAYVIIMTRARESYSTTVPVLSTVTPGYITDTVQETQAVAKISGFPPKSPTSNRLVCWRTVDAWSQTVERAYFDSLR